MRTQIYRQRHWIAKPSDYRNKRQKRAQESSVIAKGLSWTSTVDDHDEEKPPNTWTDGSGNTLQEAVTDANGLHKP